MYIDHVFWNETPYESKHLFNDVSLQGRSSSRYKIVEFGLRGEQDDILLSFTSLSIVLRDVAAQGDRHRHITYSNIRSARHLSTM